MVPPSCLFIESSKEEYDHLVGEWLAQNRLRPQQDGLTVTQVFAAYWRFAKQHYRKDGKPTSALQEIKQTLRPVRSLYGRSLAREFGPMALKAVRQHWIDAGLSRSTINKRCQAVKRVFKWAVAEELVPPDIFHGLSAVAGLRRGRTEAHETEPVSPVPDAVVEETLPHLPEVVADMVRLQRLTGCRPGEVCTIRPCDIDRTGDVWVYEPETHKTEHHGRVRLVFIGPNAQAVLRPYLLRPEDRHCFVPSESERKRRAMMHERRKTPLSYGNRPGLNRKRRPKCKPGERYDPASYRRAVRRAVEQANRKRKEEAEKNGEDGSEVQLLPKWSPNRLRHTAATEIRREFGIEGSQVVLGHSDAIVTQVYAERDMKRAEDIMRRIG